VAFSQWEHCGQPKIALRINDEDEMVGLLVLPQQLPAAPSIPCPESSGSTCNPRASHQASLSASLTSPASCYARASCSLVPYSSQDSSSTLLRAYPRLAHHRSS